MLRSPPRWRPFFERVGDKYGEDYAEYYKELLETVARVANKESAQVVEIIAGSTYSPGWDTAQMLAAQYADRVLPVVLSKSRSTLSFRRVQGLQMLGVIAERAPALSTAKRKEIRSAIVRIVDDAEPALRASAVRTVGKMGDTRATSHS